MTSRAEASVPIDPGDTIIHHARIFTDDGISLDPLLSRRVAVLGYGSQGRAQALNLRDSGVDVVVGLRPRSGSLARAAADGIATDDLGAACRGAGVIALLVADQQMAEVYEDAVRDSMAAGAALLFAHGYAIHYRSVEPPPSNDVVMVGPKAPGPALRALFEDGRGAPAVVAVDRDASGEALDLALAYAGAIGCGRAGIVVTTFAEETETDLFGEQAVLAGAASALVKAGFETLVDAGYQPEVAYWECLHELRLVVDLMATRGLAGMRAAISDTAKYGSLTRGERVISSESRAAMNAILDHIRSGGFATEWNAESSRGAPALRAALAAEAEHPIEEVGARLRALQEPVPNSPN